MARESQYPRDTNEVSQNRRASLSGEDEDPELTYEWFQKAITEDSKKLYEQYNKPTTSSAMAKHYWTQYGQ